MKKYLKKYGVLIIFIIFFFMVFIQHQFIYLYHDDYGYASLSYAYVVDSAEGHDLEFSEILEFLKGHYEIWGGRILYFFIEIILISNELWLFRLFQSIVITLIFYFIYKIVQKMIRGKINNNILALITVTLYGIFDIMLLRHSIFWFTASVLYVIPLLPFLIFIYLYQDSKNKIFKNKLIKILTYSFYAILIFLSTFSQEQVGIAALGYIVILTIYNFIENKKIDKKDIIMTIVAIIGFAILMLAPGNKIRQAHPTSIDFYSKPFVERIILGIQNLVLGNFSEYTKIFNLLFYFSITYTSIELIKKEKNKLLVYGLKLSLISIAFILYISVVKKEGYFQYMYSLINSNIYRLILIFIFVLQLLLMFITVILYLYKKKELKLINILICAVFSIACMIVAPYFPTRSSLIFEFLSFIFIIYILVDIYIKIENKKIFIYLMIPVIIFAFLNICMVTRGYYKNSLINLENEAILEETVEKIQQGEKVDKIVLKKMTDIIYGGEQPYTEGNDYILIYMKQYYNLPMDIEIIYE